MTSISSIALVKTLQESLSKIVNNNTPNNNNNNNELDDVIVEQVTDILQRLDECPMTLAILTETMIGKTVSQYKTYPQINAQVKALIKKWKTLAKQQEEESTQTENKSNNTNNNTNSKSTAAIKSNKATNNNALKRQSSNNSARDIANDTTPMQEWAGLSPLRQNICQKFHDVLKTAKSALIKEGVHADAVEHLLAPRAAETERALQEKYGRDDKSEYTSKARSLAFNLKKNLALCQQVLLGQVPADDLVKMTSEQLASAESIQARAAEAQKLIESKRLDWEQANEAKINEMCGIKGDLLQASLFTCGRCKSVKTTSTQKQTRSADEPMTVFVLCLNCGNRWKC